MLQRGRRDPCVGLAPEAVGSEDCDSPVSPLLISRATAEKYPARRHLPIENLARPRALITAFWFPGQENPAGGLTKCEYHSGPVLASSKKGACFPNTLRPLQGVETRVLFRWSPGGNLLNHFLDPFAISP